MSNETYIEPAFLLPDLIEIQRSSFRWFLEEGLIEELNSFSPITDYTGKLELHFLGQNYKLKRPKYDVDEAKRRDSTYAVQMYVPTRLSQQRDRGDQRARSVHRGSAIDDRPRHLYYQRGGASHCQPDCAIAGGVLQIRSG